MQLFHSKKCACGKIHDAGFDRMTVGRGAVRVHGGGFAGTVQAFVPLDILGAFTSEMERTFKIGSVTVLNIRPLGAIRFE